MVITNKKTGEDISGLFLKLMQGEITNEEFEKRTGLEPSKDNPNRKAWEDRKVVKKKEKIELFTLNESNFYERVNGKTKWVGGSTGITDDSIEESVNMLDYPSPEFLRGLRDIEVIRGKTGSQYNN